MDKLIVMYTEDHENPKNTWSGTSYSLRESLKKYYDVIFIDLQEGIVLKSLARISNWIGRKKKSLIFGEMHDKLLQVKANFLLRKYKEIMVLEIANEVKIRKPFCTYQDLSLDFLKEARKNELGISGGGLRSNLCDAELDRRIRVQEKIYNSSTCSFFMGNWITDYMKNKYPVLEDKFFAVGGGLNKELKKGKKVSLDEKEPLIVFVGIEFERKGGDLVLEAFKIVKSYIPDAKLLIAGPEKEFFEKKEENVMYAGRLDRNELSKQLRKASLFCMPSRFEAYGLVFPEALCYGIPCIGRRKYEMNYFIRENENGYLIDNDNIEELAKLMIKALKNKDMIKAVVENSKVEIERYSWDCVAKKIKDTIDKRDRKE